MQEYPKVLVVLVNYNGKNLLEKHLDTVIGIKYPSYDISIVDNASKDGSVEYIQSKYPNIYVIESKENLGFGRANNLAVKMYPDYDFYLFVNNDLDVNPDLISSLVQIALEDDDVAAVGPKILYSKKRDDKYVINSAGIDIANNYTGYDRYEGEFNDKKYSVVEEVDALCGACLLVRADLFNMVGGFDNRMFLYYEDVDLCLRLGDLGYKCVYNGNVEVYHDHMGSTGKLAKRKHDWWNLVNKVKSVERRKGFLVAFIVGFRSCFNFVIWKLFTSNKGISFTDHNNNVYKRK